MPKYVIERTVPGPARWTTAALAGDRRRSRTRCSASSGPDIQWVQSYVSDDKITCVYYATDADVIREHTARGGFPSTSSSSSTPPSTRRRPRPSRRPHRPTSTATPTTKGTTMNPNKELWEKGDFTRIAETHPRQWRGAW